MPSETRAEPDTLRRRLLGAALAAALGKAVASAIPGESAATHVVRPWPQGNAPLPRFDLPDLTGRRWTLAALRGRPVLLNFWASWCEPCRDEMPSLQALALRHEAAGLAVLAVNYQEAVPAIQRFLKRVPLSLPVLLDADGEAARAWTPRVFPSTVLIARSGRPRSVVMGELDWSGAAAAALVEPLLA